MASGPATAPLRTPPLRRDPGRRLLGGVCAGLWGRSGAEEPAGTGSADRGAARGRAASLAAVAAPPSAETVRRRAALVSRTSVGVALVIAAGLAFLQATGALSTARDVVLAVLVAVVALGVIFAPSSCASRDR